VHDGLCPCERRTHLNEPLQSTPVGTDKPESLCVKLLMEAQTLLGPAMIHTSFSVGIASRTSQYRSVSRFCRGTMERWGHAIELGSMSKKALTSSIFLCCSSRRSASVRQHVELAPDRRGALHTHPTPWTHTYLRSCMPPFPLTSQGDPRLCRI
jgi:hypothetical protein